MGDTKLQITDRNVTRVPTEMSLGQAVVATFEVACDGGDPNERAAGAPCESAQQASAARIEMTVAAPAERRLRCTAYSAARLKSSFEQEK